ncbi:phage tail assembly chaperone [Arsenophonus sp.]|uniref:phage tail assembly chaperone n=1 Tax=Arsenophonus sp. TaxID=1872640 RepID=UPI0038D3D610
MKIDAFFIRRILPEIELNGHEYRATKLSVFDQLKGTRKLLPVLSGLTGELQKLQQGEMPMAAVLPIMANAIAQMSDEDCNAILHPCLAVVSRKNEQGIDADFSARAS